MELRTVNARFVATIQGIPTHEVSFVFGDATLRLLMISETLVAYCLEPYEAWGMKSPSKRVRRYVRYLLKEDRLWKMHFLFGGNVFTRNVVPLMEALEEVLKFLAGGKKYGRENSDTRSKEVEMGDSNFVGEGHGQGGERG